MTLASNIYMSIALYMACNIYICTILCGLLESTKISLFKDLLEKIFEAQVAENGFFFAVIRHFELNYLQNIISKYDFRWFW